MLQKEVPLGEDAQLFQYEVRDGIIPKGKIGQILHSKISFITEGGVVSFPRKNSKPLTEEERSRLFQECQKLDDQIVAAAEKEGIPKEEFMRRRIEELRGKLQYAVVIKDDVSR